MDRFGTLSLNTAQYRGERRRRSCFCRSPNFNLHNWISQAALADNKTQDLLIINVCYFERKRIGTEAHCNQNPLEME